MPMLEYGYMEDGYLRSQKLSEPVVQKYENEDGEIQTRTITVEEQAAILGSQGWKPVDPIDEDRADNAREGYFMRITPYDAGDRISFLYTEVVDIQMYKKSIKDLKDQLSATDYKVIKCNEALMLGKDLPYDMNAVYSERQAIRDKINELEDKLKSSL